MKTIAIVILMALAALSAGCYCIPYDGPYYYNSNGYYYEYGYVPCTIPPAVTVVVW